MKTVFLTEKYLTMTKTQQELWGSRSEIEGNFIKLNIYDLYNLAQLQTLVPPETSDIIGLTALIIKALSESTSPTLDDNDFAITDNTQGVVADTRSSRTSIVTRDNVKQVQHKFVFNIFTENQIRFDPVDVIGSTTEVNNAGEGIQF